MSKIVSTDDTLGGAPRIEGGRIGVHHVAKRVIDAGESPEQVAADYDLDIADVYRALAYDYDSPDEMWQVQSERQFLEGDYTIIEGPDDLDREVPSEHEA